MASALKLADVTKAVSPRFSIRALDLDLGAAEFLVLLGPSGCGKSTLLRLVAGLDAPDAGRIEIDGRVASDPKVVVPPEARGIGMVFQSLALWPHFTAEGQLRFVLGGKVPKAEIPGRVKEALDLVGLGRRAGAYPNELSGGEAQRLAIARAIVTRPRLLLLDEPLSGADEVLRERLCGEIRALQRRLALPAIYVTHHREEALAVADRVAVMRAGRVEQIGPPRELWERPASEFVARFVGLGNVLRGRATADGRVETALGPVALESANGRLAPGASVVVALRPESIEIVSAGGVAARLDSAAYRGDRCLVRVTLGGESLALFAPSAPSGDVRVAAKGPGIVVAPENPS